MSIRAILIGLVVGAACPSIALSQGDARDDAGRVISGVVEDCPGASTRHPTTCRHKISPAASLADVEVARNVTLTLTDGQTLQGRVVEVTPRSLKLATGRVLTHVPEEDVWMIDSRSRSRLRGMLLGAAAPTGVAVLARGIAVLTRGCCFPLSTPSRLGIMTAAGASIGTLFGVPKTRPLFHRASEAARGPRLTMVPVLAGQESGLALSLSW